MKKHGLTITLALIGTMALLLVFQQGESIRLLKFQVTMLQGQVDRLQSEFTTVKLETDRLKSLQKLDSSMINTVYDTELKRSLAYCRLFPQAKNCKELLAMFAGQDLTK